jgi:hypothetical protein
MVTSKISFFAYLTPTLSKLEKEIKGIFRDYLIYLLLAVVLFSSCNKLYDTKQELNPEESQLYSDWYEYRSAAMGLYALQQKLVEQLVILGELRGDLLQITPNADADMIEIYNFNVSKNNKYASPIDFFKLISACNSFIRNVQTKYPDVLNPNKPINLYYDNVYGEALCMRAWAYFNAARIYRKVPFIPEELSTIDQIEGYVNSPVTYRDSVFINFNIDGYHNDTIRKDTTFVKKYYDLPMIINTFTRQLENEIKYQGGTYGVGVNYAKDNGDPTWEVITWHPFSMFALLGHMYLTRGNFSKAKDYFSKITSNSTMNDLDLTNNRYGLSNMPVSWLSFFNRIDPQEHIFTIWFNKDNHQQNRLQDFFTNKVMMKPTKIAVSKWENCWRGQVIDRDPKPELTTMTTLGTPGDFIRGYDISYVCGKDFTTPVLSDNYLNMMILRSKGDLRGANAIMDGMDTFVCKYSLNKSQYSGDANYIIYRAGSIHLYLAEIYVNWYEDGIKTNHREVERFLNMVNNSGIIQLGVRGRVGLATGYDRVIVDESVIYHHDPYTNKIIGYTDYTENTKGKIQYLEDKILNERALELGFEGERFYDIMRIAKRRNDPSYLASKISAKYPSEQRQAIYSLLLNENNWYINYFE